MSSEKIKFQRLSPDVVIPKYATEGSACFDISSNEDYNLKPRERRAICTGLKVEISPDYEIQIRPRSGLALKYGITIPNSPGTVDSDYRGEVKVILMNQSEEIFSIKKGDRIAQGALVLVTRATLEEVAELSQTSRGEGGFGHTGIGSVGK